MGNVLDVVDNFKYVKDHGVKNDLAVAILVLADRVQDIDFHIGVNDADTLGHAIYRGLLEAMKQGTLTVSASVEMEQES